MRRLASVFLFALVLLALGWTAAWWWIAGRVDAAVAQALQEEGPGEVALDCAGQRVAGYPLSFDVICEEATLAHRPTATTASLAGLRAATPVWALRSVGVDLRSPAVLNGPFGPVTIAWRDAGFDTTLDQPPTEPTQFRAAGVEVASGALAVTADAVAAEIAPAAGDTTLATAAVSSAQAVVGAQALPIIDGAFRAVVAAPMAALASGAIDPRRDGLEVPELALSLRSGAVRIEAEGGLALTPEGLPNGRVTVWIAGLDALPDLVAALPEQARGGANAAVGAILAFGRQIERDGAPAREFELRLERGEARLGLIGLGRLPPLW